MEPRLTQEIESPHPRMVNAAIAVCLALQFAFLAVLVFGDIGFDHPGRFGLSFNHGIIFIACYLTALVCGLLLSIKNRRWFFAAVHIAIPVLFFVISSRPAPKYQASDYQHLVGKSKAEVKTALSSRRAFSGFRGSPDGDYEFTSYRGMTILYDNSGTVVEVKANNR